MRRRKSCCSLTSTLDAAILVLALFGGAALNARAAVPANFVYQGSLKQNGAPLNGSAQIEFRLTNADGSQIYWTSGVQTVAVKEGLYRMDLAPAGVDWNGIDPYLEMRVGGTALLPREKLSATPYAWIAKDLAADASAKGNFQVNGRIAIATTTVNDAALTVNGASTFASTATASKASLLKNKNEMLYLERTGNKWGTIAVVNADASATTTQANALMLTNKSNNIIGSVYFGKYSNGYSGIDDAGIPYSNSARLGISGDNIARWVWELGNNSTHEGLYFEAGSPMAVKARLTSSGQFFAKGLAVNTDNPTDTLEATGRTKLTGPVSASARSGALRVIGTNDTSHANMISFEGSWPSAYGSDRSYVAGYTLDGYNNFVIMGNGGFWSASTRALKENIRRVPNSLDLVSKMTGVRYKWKGDTSGTESIGFVAEDLATVLPEAVHEGRLVNYAEVIPVLVEAIKDLKARVEQLESSAK